MRAFTRRQMLHLSAVLAASSLLEGCTVLTAPRSSSGILPVPTSPNPQPAPVVETPVTEATLSILLAGTTSAPLNPFVVGLSYEKSALSKPVFTAANTSLIALFDLLGNTNTLRLGGNSVDTQVWTQTGSGQTALQIAPADVDALAAFLKATGWRCLYGINLGGSATGATTPALAAAEAAYVAQKLGTSLAGFEIGNECDLYGNPGSYYAGNWSLAQFSTLWEQYRKAIAAAVPAAVITGPAAAGSESTWTVPFAQSLPAKELSLLTQHYYRGSGLATTATAAALVTPDTAFAADLRILSTASQALGIPFAIAEANSYSNGGAPGVSNAYASALWAIDFLMTAALYGAAGVALHGGGGSSYTPITDNNGVVVAARPEYYGALLCTLAGAGEQLATSLSAGGLNITAYAVETLAGLSIILVNKDSTQTMHLTAQVPIKIGHATLFALTQLSPGASGPSLTATDGVTLQGATVTATGSFAPAPGYSLLTSGSTFTCYVPPLSAALILIS